MLKSSASGCIPATAIRLIATAATEATEATEATAIRLIATEGTAIRLIATAATATAILIVMAATTGPAAISAIASPGGLRSIAPAGAEAGRSKVHHRGGLIMKRLGMLGIIGGAALLAAVPFSLQ